MTARRLKYQYDLLNRLTEISNTNSSAEVLNQHVFTYNNWDFRGSETITGSALPSMPSVEERTKDYDYNTVNQLLASINPSQVFAYDADGNMTQGSVLAQRRKVRKERKKRRNDSAAT